MATYKKLITLLLTLAITISCTTSGWAFMVGEYAAKGAIVGKNLRYDVTSGTFLVYGRMSSFTQTDQGSSYKVFETGKFFRVKPMTNQALEDLNNRIDQGIKAFGPYQMTHDGSNQEMLLAYEVFDYDPSSDAGIIEPAYGEEAGYWDWTGFGVSTLAYKGQMFEMKKPTTVVDNLAKLEPLLLINGRVFDINGGTPVILDESTGERFTVQDVMNALTTDPAQVAAGNVERPKFIPASWSEKQYREWLKTLQEFWKKTFIEIDYLEWDQQALMESIQSVGGNYFVNGLRGKKNTCLKSVPAIRPDIDKFMKVIEAQQEQPFVKWASPAVLYGYINGVVPTEYLGPYFPSIETFIDAIGEASKKGQLIPQGGEDKDQYKQSERWQIGWDSKESLCKICPPTMTKEYNKMTAWISGTRVLVYLITVYPPNGDPYSYFEHVTSGKLDEQNPPPYTTIEYIGKYIAVDYIISKPAHDFMLSVVREVAKINGI